MNCCAIARPWRTILAMKTRLLTPLCLLVLAACSASSATGEVRPDEAPQGTSADAPADFDGYVSAVNGSSVTVVTRTNPETPINVSFTPDSALLLWVAFSNYDVSPITAEFSAISVGSRISGTATSGVVSRADVEDLPKDCSLMHGTLQSTSGSTLSVNAPTGALAIPVSSTAVVVERTMPDYSSRIIDDLTTAIPGSKVFAVSCADALKHIELVR